ncbi:MAG: rsmG [Clostridiales bacterium]|jgi:16S rRNA (guanine527-N7)-methyltransferase|nr:rsmG [Clostridiales bacterium]
MEYRSYPQIELFQEGLDSLKVELNDLQKQQFIDYYELLIKWNEVMNLTTITEFSEVLRKHFIDSLSLVKVYSPSKEKILDMGTGAGFPGIPLKIAFPDTEIVLMDSLNKRIHFLNEVITKLGLNKISAIHGRAEDYGRSKDYREKFDLCVSRAVAKLSTLSEYCLPYVKKDGFFISYKSGKVEEELNQADNSFKLLGARVKDTSYFTLPGTNMERTLVILQKTATTPNRFPRNAGKPSKEPL